MILEKQTDIEILVDGDENQSSIGMSLDLDSAQMLMQMLSKNLYSDGIGSTIRETASNALDSHRRANVTDPIVVSLKRNKEDNYEFSVEDFGSGLDNDDVENIISKYGKSTKRMEANALGMFGLGFKSPLAYSSSFFFICRKNGIERKYMMYEGEDVNTIDCLYTTNTKEKNGVKVIVPVKFNDRYEFFKKTKEQLAYFENVYFDVRVDSTIINNDFIISRGQSFQFSELTTNASMHICLDNVYYPLDWEKIGIPVIPIPIGLRFNLTDGIFPTPNRESIRYTPEAKAVIMNKITEVADYYMTKFNSGIAETMDVINVLNFFNSKVRSIDAGFGNYKFHITELLEYSTIKMVSPSITGITKLDLKRIALNQSILLSEYTNRYRLVNGRFTEIKSYWQKNVNIHGLTPKVHLYSEKFVGLKKAYLKDVLSPSDTHIFIKKISPFKLFNPSKSTNIDCYFKLLNLSNIPRKEWRDHIKEFQYLQTLLLSGTQNIDNLKVPQSWIDNRKKVAVQAISTSRKLKLKGEVSCKVGTELLRYVDGKNSKLEPLTLKLEEIEKQPCLYIYGVQEDVMKLDAIFHIVSGVQKVKTLVFSERESRVIEKAEIHNLISLKEFMEGKNKVFKRLISAYLIDELVKAHSFVFHHRECLNGISTSLFNDLEKLLLYKGKNYSHVSDEIYKAMLEVAKEHNLFDGNIHSEYLRIKTILEKLPFLNPVLRSMSPSIRGTNLRVVDDMKNVLCDLFKYYRFRIDYTNYHLKLDDESIEGEVLDESKINQLIN